MATLTLNFNDPAVSLGNGAAVSGGQGESYVLTVGGTFEVGDLYTVTMTDSTTGIATQVGAGFATGAQPTFIKTFKNKIYALDGSTAYFCGEGEPTTFNNPNDPTNGFITLSDWWSTSENLQAVAPFQGNLCFVSRRDVQIWAVDPDTSNYAQAQVLPNVGTFCGNTVQPVGDMDIYMLYDSGVRSVRVRVASDNAIIADIGTPIDAILQPILAGLTAAQQAACCSIVDPTQNRYWVFIPNASDPDNGVGKIYVFSSFVSSQVEAWSTYSPTYQSAIPAPAGNYPGSGPITLTYAGLTVGQRYAWTPGANEVSITDGTSTLMTTGAFIAAATSFTVTGKTNGASFTGALTQTVAFTPQNFCVLGNQVWIRDTTGNFYQVGGSNLQTYENCGVTAVTPYIDGGSPGQHKNFLGIDAGLQGTWTVGMGTDYNTQGYKTVLLNAALPTFLYQKIGWEATGTHFSGQMIESGNGYARFSNLIVHLKQGDEK